MLRRLTFAILTLLMIDGSLLSEEKEPVRNGKPLSQWIAQLRTGSLSERAAAAEEFWWMSFDITPAVPALAEALGADGQNLPYNAARALGQVGPKGKAAVPALVQAIRNKDARVRGMAISSLRRIEPDCKSLIATMVKDLTSPQPAARVIATEVLASLGHPDEAAASALSGMLNQETDDSAKLALAIAIVRTGGKDPRVVPILVQELNNKRSLKVPAIPELLFDFGTKESLTALVRAATHPDQRVRMHVEWTLSRVQPKNEFVIPALVEMSKDQDAKVRYIALRALGRMKSAAEKVVPELLKALDDDGRSSAATQALDELAASPTATPVLLAALHDKSAVVRRGAAWSLRQTRSDPGPVVAVLAKALGDGDESVRSAAAYSLARFGRDAKPAVPALTMAMKDPSPNVCREAATALEKIDPEAFKKAGQ